MITIKEQYVIDSICDASQYICYYQPHDFIRAMASLAAGLDFKGRFIFYAGPLDPAGPTTAMRMDKFTDTMLKKTGLLGMIGKAERGACRQKRPWKTKDQ